jgi:hypothetical protein
LLQGLIRPKATENTVFGRGQWVGSYVGHSMWVHLLSSWKAHCSCGTAPGIAPRTNWCCRFSPKTIYSLQSRSSKAYVHYRKSRSNLWLRYASCIDQLSWRIKHGLKFGSSVLPPGYLRTIELSFEDLCLSVNTGRVNLSLSHIHDMVCKQSPESISVEWASSFGTKLGVARTHKTCDTNTKKSTHMSCTRHQWPLIWAGLASFGSRVPCVW